jgi:hypothetical protein
MTPLAIIVTAVLAIGGAIAVFELRREALAELRALDAEEPEAQEARPEHVGPLIRPLVVTHLADLVSVAPTQEDKQRWTPKSRFRGHEAITNKLAVNSFRGARIDDAPEVPGAIEPSDGFYNVSVGAGAMEMMQQLRTGHGRA